MIMCEDFPACGHEQGCCPRFENGVQMDMVCTCGARLPKDNPTSICNTCLQNYSDEDYHQDTPLYEDYYGGE